jgi:hypothetical protein
MTTAFPLAWPDGWPRTPQHRRQRSAFRVTPDKARKNLLNQIKLLGGAPGRTVISSNMALRQDGQPYADALRRTPADPGVAVYFVLRGKPFAMARDHYLTPHENMHALGHAIEHMRGLERHGGAHMVDRAFSGFAALPPPSAGKSWWEILGVSRSASRDEILAAHRKLAVEHHPDRGGDADKAAEINAARDSGLAERSLA